MRMWHILIILIHFVLENVSDTHLEYRTVELDVIIIRNCLAHISYAF